MKERLGQLLDLEQITPSKFADIIGVQRSSVSHVISGRNKPSFDFLQKTLKAFPGLNADWLILGEGSMYEQMGRVASGNLFDPPAAQVKTTFPEDISNEEPNVDRIDDFKQTSGVPLNDAVPDETHQEPEVVAQTGTMESNTSRKVVQVMVFYDDDTFKSFKASQ